jgi:hypothetical protein
MIVSRKAEHLDLLLGYYLLARHQRPFPEIKRTAIYFARHRYVWEQPTTCWTDKPEFQELERWFAEQDRPPTVPSFSAPALPIRSDRRLREQPRSTRWALPPPAKKKAPAAGAQNHDASRRELS